MYYVLTGVSEGGWFIKFTLLNLNKKRTFLNGSIAEYVLVAIIFSVLTFLYTDGTLLNGTSSLFVQEPGDGTAGLTWVLFADNGLNPFYYHTDIVNYPEGINLFNPTYITALLIQLPAWLLSRFMPALMAINIMMYIAFVGIALLGYWLLKRLTNTWHIAFLAAYAFTFMPYHMFKSVAHIANIFSWVFIALVGASIYLWRAPSWKSSLAVALALTAGFYTDGYYLLLSSVTVVSLSVGGLLAKMLLNRKAAKDYMRGLAVSAGMTAVAVLPIALVQVYAGSQIESDLSGARTDIKTEAAYYSAWTSDFLTPPAYNPFFEWSPLYGEVHEAKANRSNVPESALYIGYVVIGLTAVGMLMVCGLLLGSNKKYRLFDSLNKAEKDTLITLSCFVIVTIPVILSFMGPLERSIFGSIKVPMLSGILTDHTSLWRVLTRFILPLHSLLVVYAGYSLYILTRILPLRQRYAWTAVVIVLTGFVAVEYTTTVNRPAFTLSRMPQTYWEIRKRNDIRVLAELPITDKPVEVNGYYATGQLIHGKKLVNSHVIKHLDGAKSALGDENNPETIDYIRLRGADHVIVHSETCSEHEWGKLKFSEKLQDDIYRVPRFHDNNHDYVCLYELNDAPKVADSNFLALDLEDYTDASGHQQGLYETYAKTPSVTLRIVDDGGEKVPAGRKVQIGLHVRSRSSKDYLWMATRGGRFVANGRLGVNGEASLSVLVDTGEAVELTFYSRDNVEYVVGDLALRQYAATALQR